MVIEYARGTLRSDPGFLGGFRIEELNVSDPYRDYGVGLTNLASGHLLSAAESHGSWMYLFLHGTNTVGAGGLIADEKTGRALKATGLFQTDCSAETRAVLRQAEQLPQVKKSDYEFRRLDVPGILFVGVWLHGETDDIIIPMGNTFGRWNAGQPYSERQILKRLKLEARIRLKAPAEFD